MPIPLHRAQDAQAIDRYAIETLGVAAYTLMRRAGDAAWVRLKAHWPAAHRIGVLCGPGNNGGDGYVLARLARIAGAEVQVVILPGGEPRSESARQAHADWLAAGGNIMVFAGSLPVRDVWVDALFGIGLARVPEGFAAAAIQALNAQMAPVLALDVPSGVDADTGAAAGVSVRADVCIEFIVGKCGLHTGAGRDSSGHRESDALGLPHKACAAVPPYAWLYRQPDISAFLGPRPGNAHKGLFGHVLCVGGERGMAGAITLCAAGALRAGAGLVSVATRTVNVPIVQGQRAELMVSAAESAEELAPLLERASVVVIGPGFGSQAWAANALQATLDAGKPLVLDADALNLLARTPRQVPNAVLTPHPGEAARLLASDVATVQRDRFAAATALAQRYQACVVLKGAGTVIAAPGGHPCIVDAGNPGMASGGMGDVLAGVIAALRAQGLDGYEAALCGALVHGCAGDLAAADGERGLLASDLLPAIRQLVNPVCI
ncbi:MAG: bifunctional ADP-dependent NAD(P)H-hydrate dehydratase/NAD(P)H-hydrate epimerase [Gammaproteobacteria bacterium HGW-Gammaproteobacteria-2]|jgi:NAD(P)H-hydrate epimerase|nr:MAG: bifunctional ADP-dependent NAD(P)H-hydrate dehydratase/NAD(P)H-hydrate epimerase [Gammaproteobacteria bacterium HGW-Gammaproteobacteria-2]